MERLGRSDIDGKAARIAESEWATSESIHREMRRFATRDLGKRLLAGTARRIGDCRRGKARAFAKRVRRANRDFRHHPEASEDFLMHFLILPSSFFLSHGSHGTFVSCAATICHFPSRFSHVSVQMRQCFVSLPSFLPCLDRAFRSIRDRDGVAEKSHLYLAQLTIALERLGICG